MSITEGLDSSTMGKKLGPLPIWAWGLAGVGGYVAYKKFASRGAAVSSDGTAGASNGGPSSSDGIGVSGQAPSGGGVGSGFSDGSSSNTTQTWASQAVNYLVQNGQVPIAASNAITAYLAGKPLSPAQQNMVNIALSALGSPPGGPVASTGTGPAPTGPAHTAPPGPSIKIDRVSPSSARATWGNATGAAKASSWKVVVVANGHSATHALRTPSIMITGLTKGSKVTVDVTATSPGGSSPTSTAGYTQP